MATPHQDDELALIKREIQNLYEFASKLTKNDALARQMFTAERRDYFIYCHRRLERLVGPERAVAIILEIVDAMEEKGLC